MCQLDTWSQLSSFKNPPPASVIRTRATSIERRPMTTRSAVAVASPGADQFGQLIDGEAWAKRIASVHPSGRGGEQLQRAAAGGLGGCGEGG
jgi:hypothetical protein